MQLSLSTQLVSSAKNEYLGWNRNPRPVAFRAIALTIELPRLSSLNSNHTQDIQLSNVPNFIPNRAVIACHYGAGKATLVSRVGCYELICDSHCTSRRAFRQNLSTCDD